VQLLILMLDNPQLVDQVLQAWTDLGLRGIHVLETAACAEPEERGRRRARGPTGLLSFAHLLAVGQYCYALMLAPAASEAQAEQAAEAVGRIAGPWERRPGPMMFALPVAAHWGAAVTAGEESRPPGQEGGR
jgi:hypothetical protein